MKTREKVKLFFLFIFYCVITQQVFAQKRTISGTVTSNPQLNFQQLSNNFLPCMRVLCLSFVLL